MATEHAAKGMFGFRTTDLDYRRSLQLGGTIRHPVAQWLRRYVKSGKVAGSRPDGVADLYQFT
jgi:hypothetical protein